MCWRRVSPGEDLLNGDAEAVLGAEGEDGGDVAVDEAGAGGPEALSGVGVGPEPGEEAVGAGSGVNPGVVEGFDEGVGDGTAADGSLLTKR